MTMSFALRVVAFFCLLFFATADAATTVVVVSDLARVVLLPHGDAKLLGLAKKGDQFKVISKKDDWYNIEYKTTIGWIFQDYVKPEAKPEAKAETASNVPATASPKPLAPSSPAPAPQPASIQTHQTPLSQRQQNAPEVKKQPEKPAAVAEKTESRLKKPQVKQKKNQLFAVDLPPAPVTPSDATKEKTLPVAEDTTAVGPPPAPAAAALPQSPSVVPKEPDVSAQQPEKSVAKQERPPLAVGKDSLPAVRSQGKGEETKKYFEILDNSVKVLASVNPNSPILGMARKHDCYILLFEGQSWCKIRFGNAEGWVERRLGRAVDSPSMAKNIPRILIFASVGCGVLIILVLLIVFITVSLRTKAARKVAVRKDLLVIAHSEKDVQLSLTDSSTSLSKCFSEIGFKVNYASDMDHARNLLMHYLPDVVVVDWQLGNNVKQAVESVLMNRTSTANILVIFYNVPDVASVSESQIIPNAQYLGISFSDRDVFKLVTPLILTESETKSVRRSVESSALGGEIGQGSLIEVMQFIEIGRKTGCLYIVIEKPFGLLYFEQGRLTYAASQAKQGREAVFEILGLKTGRFHFVLDKVSETKNVNLSTLEILMEWTKTVDEAHRA
jgi:uncharacterized protein YraI